MIQEYWLCEAKRCDNGEIVQGYPFHIQNDGCVVTCIEIEPLSANDYSEIYSSCYCEVNPETVRKVKVKPEKYQDGEETFYQCPNCKQLYLTWAPKVMNCCIECGLKLDWSGENE